MSLMGIVKQTMVSLSDGVNHMMLMMVPLQEQNAAMGDTLPHSVRDVTGLTLICFQRALSYFSNLLFSSDISTRMSEVADNLAKMEYSEYPQIQQEIFEASHNVRQQVTLLNKALSDLEVISLIFTFITFKYLLCSNLIREEKRGKIS
jgi:HAMP domain-containing protein